MLKHPPELYVAKCVHHTNVDRGSYGPISFRDLIGVDKAYKLYQAGGHTMTYEELRDWLIAFAYSLNSGHGFKVQTAFVLHEQAASSQT